MQIDIVIFRVLHIVFGAFWVGTALFMALFLRPRLMLISSEINRKLIISIEQAVNVSTGISGVVTILAGIVLVIKLRGSRLDTLFNTGWGYAILIGIIAAICAFIAGGISASLYARAASLANETQDPSPGDTKSASASDLDSRIVIFERLHAMFVLIAVGSMASARFV